MALHCSRVAYVKGTTLSMRRHSAGSRAWGSLVVRKMSVGSVAESSAASKSANGDDAVEFRNAQSTSSMHTTHLGGSWRTAAATSCAALRTATPRRSSLATAVTSELLPLPGTPWRRCTRTGATWRSTYMRVVSGSRKRRASASTSVWTPPPRNTLLRGRDGCTPRRTHIPASSFHAKRATDPAGRAVMSARYSTSAAVMKSVTRSPRRRTDRYRSARVSVGTGSYALTSYVRGPAPQSTLPAPAATVITRASASRTFMKLASVGVPRGARRASFQHTAMYANRSRFSTVTSSILCFDFKKATRSP